MIQNEDNIPHKAKQAVLTAVLKYDYLGTYFDPLNKAEEFRVLVKMWFQRLVAVLQQQMRAAFWPDTSQDKQRHMSNLFYIPISSTFHHPVAYPFH